MTVQRISVAYRQDFLSSGANVGRANNVCTEARNAESAQNAGSRREAPSEIGEGFGEGAR